MNPVLAAFLRQHGWPLDQVTPFPADWSARRYARLQRETAHSIAEGRLEAPERAILMEATPDADFLAFIRVDEILRTLKIAAPDIYAADTAQGYLVLEDFGDRNFGRLLDDSLLVHGDEAALLLFLRAVDSLCQIQRRSLAHSEVLQALPHFDNMALIDLLNPLLDNFTYQDPAGAKAALQDVWHKALAPCAAMPHALLMRDFMPDNLMDIPARADGQTVGVLDFELAGVGPLAYDVASLTEQVRRDLPVELRQAVYAAYVRQWPELEPAGFIDAVHLLSVQRHARTFARLKSMQKPDFYIRTFSFLQQQLQHPACHSVRGWFTRFMPDYFS